MLNVFFMVICFVLGVGVGIFIAAMGYSRYMIGSLKMIYVGNHLERTQLEFDSHEAKSKVNGLNYAFLKINRINIEDPDGDPTQEIQLV